MKTVEDVLPPDTRQIIEANGLEQLQMLLDEGLPAPPFALTTDIRPLHFESGIAVFEGRPSSRFYNPMGVVHGGWITALLDTAMACAVHTTLAAGESYSTIELKSVFVRAVQADTGRLRAEGKLLHAGNRVAHADGRIFDATGRLVAYGSESCLINR